MASTNDDRGEVVGVHRVISFGLGADLASAATITITDSFHYVTGSATIDTINFSGGNPSDAGMAVLVPSAGATFTFTTTGGNITGTPPTPQVGIPIYCTYDGTNWTLFSTPNDNTVTNAILRDSGALSVIGRSANSTGDPADISAVAGSGAVLREASNVLGFGTVATAGLANNAVTDAKLRQSAALSVIGNATNTTANVADIAAGLDWQVLRRSGTAVGFGALSLATAAAVTGILPVANGGTGATLAATGGASQVLKQTTLGGAITVGQLATTDLSDNTSIVKTANAQNIGGAKVFTTSLAVGSTGGVFTSILVGSATYDPPGVTANSTASTTLTVTGAATTDWVVVGFTGALSGLSLTGYCNTTNTITAWLGNPTGSTINPTSGTLWAMVFKQ